MYIRRVVGFISGKYVVFVFWKYKYQLQECCDLISRFNPVTYCVPVPCQEMDSPRHISWYFFFLCLNFLSVNFHDILINRKYFLFELKTLKLHLLWFKMMFIYCYIYIFYSNKIFVIYYRALDL